MESYDLSIVEHAADKALLRRRHEKRNRIVFRVVLVAALAAIAAGAFLIAERMPHGAEAGATISDYKNMTREEIQAQLDEQVENSMMTVAVSPVAVIEDDGTVSLTVSNDESNPMPQKFTVTQNGADVYESQRIEPGQTISSCVIESLEPGDAAITVQGLDDETGEAKGSPAAVEVKVRTADDIG